MRLPLGVGAAANLLLAIAMRGFSVISFMPIPYVVLPVLATARRRTAMFTPSRIQRSAGRDIERRVRWGSAKSVNAPSPVYWLVRIS
jgi:hypothetical protein